MSRTSLKQQLMREQMVQQERKEALARQQQLQKLQSNSRLTPQHLNIGSTVINNNGNLNNNATSSVIAIAGAGGGSGGRPIPHSLGHMKISEAASCPSFFTDGFNNNAESGPHSSILPLGSSSSSTLITSSTTTATSSNTITPSKVTNPSHHHASHHHSSLMGGNANGSGPQSPFPLSPDSPHSGPRSSASEMDEIWEDVQRTLVMEMPDLIDQNGGGNNEGAMGSEHVVSNSINVIHHSHHHPSSSHHSPMDPMPATLPADIGYSFNPHQLYGGEDSIQSTSHLSDVTKMSSSCPPLSTSCPPLSDPEFSAWERERKKKDAHNKIERRRRYNINDRIKELSTLLPTQDETYYDLVKDMKQNKGTILKASVDFVRELKKDVSRIPELEQKNRELELENRKITLRLQQLEQDLRTQSISEEPHGLYKPDSSAPKSIQFGQQMHHHHAHHIHHSNHHETPTPPPHPQSLPHHLSHSFHHSSETDYWINGGITLDDNLSTGQPGSLQSHPQHLSSMGHHASTDVNSDLVESIYGSSRMSTHHPIIKQEYNVSPSQSSSGLGSLSSPTSLGSSFLPLSQMLINDSSSKDSLGINSHHVKGELPSPQVMDVCD